MRNTILAILLPLCAAQLSAQEEEVPDTSARSAWFIYTDLPDGVANPVKVMSGTQISELTLSKRSVGGPVKIPADGIISIVKEVPDPANPDKTVHVALAQAKVPEGANKVLVILIPLKKPEGHLVFGTKVQSLAGFKGGDWLYLNLTKADIGVQIGALKMVVKPGGMSIQGSPDVKEATNMTISYNYRLPQEKEWKLLTASTVVVMPTRREICVFSADPQFGRISYHGLTFPVE